MTQDDSVQISVLESTGDGTWQKRSQKKYVGPRGDTTPTSVKAPRHAPHSKRTYTYTRAPSKGVLGGKGGHTPPPQALPLHRTNLRAPVVE